MQKRVVLYLRVSSQKQVDNFSLENQELNCREYCQKNDYEIAKVFNEPGESAKTADRPEFQAMLLYCRKKENDISTVVFYHSSRFSRDTKDLLMIQADLARYGVNLDSASEPMIREMSPESRLYTTIVSSFNQYENENRARSTAGGMKRRFLEGYPISNPPLGYKLTKPVGEKSQAIPDDYWFPLLKNLWLRTIDERLTLREIVKQFNIYGRGKRKFSKSTVDDLFHQPFFYGMMRSNKYGEVLGRHQPMITKDQFYQAKAVLEGRSMSNSCRSHYREDFMLRGLLNCPDCGHRMTSCWSTGKRKPFAYYLCSGRTHKSKNIPRDLIEGKFRELLRELQPTPEYINFYTAFVIEKYEARNKTIVEASQTVKKDITKLEEMLKTLKEKHLQGIYNDTDFVSTKDDLETKILAKRNLLADKDYDIDEIKVMIEWLKVFLTNLEKLFITAKPEIRQLLGCSIFPNGLKFIDGNFQTPEISQCFALKEDKTGMPSASVTQSIEFWNQLVKELKLWSSFLDNINSPFPAFATL